MDIDIDDLLSEENRVPIVGNGAEGSLDYILGVDEDEELPEQVEIPFWAVECLRQLKVITPKVPKMFDQRMQGRMKAQAWSINLREHFYFYEYALKLSTADRAHGAGGNGLGQETFRTVLRKALASRYSEIMRESLSSRGQDISEFCDGSYSSFVNVRSKHSKHSNCAMSLQSHIYLTDLIAG